MDAPIRLLRQLQPLQLPALFDIALKFFAESKLPGEFSPDSFMQAWTGFIKSGMGAIFAASEGGKIIGAIGLMRYSDINTGVPQALEAFWYVEPEHREYGVGMLLLEQAEQWAIASHCKRLIMAAILIDGNERVQNFYRDNGFKAVEVNYVKEL